MSHAVPAVQEVATIAPVPPCACIDLHRNAKVASLVIEWIRGVYTPQKPSSANKPLPVTHGVTPHMQAIHSPWQPVEMRQL
jgi:hypothetical protein